MEIFATPGNPVPPDPVVLAVRTRDGIRLRAVRWQARRDPDRDGQGAAAPPAAADQATPAGRGTVVVVAGRSEFIESYFSVVRALLARGFDVVAFDWRGQGFSDRQIAARHRGHVSSFAAYQRDLLAVEAQVLQKVAPRPWFALAHSMGAAILLDQAHRGTSPFDRLVLTAPMIDVALRQRGAKRLLIRAMDLCGLGSRCIPGGSERPLFTRRFDGNLLTADREQYDRLAAVVRDLAELTVGAPTVRWLASALDLMDRFRDPRFAVNITVPVLMIAAGADRIVDTAAAERFALRLRAGRCVTLPGARHQLTMERKEVLAQFWAAFDAFVPGDAPAMPRPAPPAPARRVERGPLHRLAVRVSQPFSGRGRPARAP